MELPLIILEVPERFLKDVLESKLKNLKFMISTPIKVRKYYYMYVSKTYNITHMGEHGHRTMHINTNSITSPNS